MSSKRALIAKKLTAMFCGIICSLILSATAAAQAEQLPKTAKLLPPETVMVISIEDFVRFKQQIEKTTIYKFYKDPSMAAFIENAKSKWHDSIKKLDENDLFKAIVDADVPPSGKVAFAMILDEKKPDVNEPVLVLITQWGQNVDKIKQAISKLVDKNTELGGSRKKGQDYRDIVIETLIDETGSILHYCFIDDVFIAGGDIDITKLVIAHIKGSTGPALADDSDYTSAMAAIGEKNDIAVYVNIKQITKTILAQDSSGEARNIMKNLGFDNFTGLASSVNFAAVPGSSYNGKLFLKINGAKKGIFKMLEAEAAPLRPAQFVPASVYAAVFLNLDIKKAYNELYNIIYSFNPTAAAFMYTPLVPPGPDGEPGLQLKNDIIDHLGSEIIIAQSVNKPFSKDSNPTQTLVALATNNPKQLEKSLALFHGTMIAANNPNARRELLGHTLYLIIMPKLNQPRNPATPMAKIYKREKITENLQHGPVADVAALAFTVTGTHLICGPESMVEQAIRTLSSASAPSIASARWFNRAKSAIPSAVGLASLQDIAASTEFMWWLLKETNNLPNSPVKGHGFDMQEFDFSLLPPFETVKKYFGLYTAYGISREDGFMMEYKDINPLQPE